MKVINNNSIYNLAQEIEVLKRELEIKKLHLKELILEMQLKDTQERNDYFRIPRETIIKRKINDILDEVGILENERNKTCDQLNNVTEDSPELGQCAQKEYNEISQILDNELITWMINKIRIKLDEGKLVELKCIDPEGFIYHDGGINRHINDNMLKSHETLSVKRVDEEGDLVLREGYLIQGVELKYFKIKST